MREKLPILALAFVCGFGSACKKYEEGPVFSLRSKKERVVNEWNTTEIVTNGGTLPVNPSVLEYYWKFTKNGDCEYALITSTTTTAPSKGTWKFSDKKDQIIMDWGNTADTLTILRLKEKELWVHVQIGQDGTEHHLVPKE